MNTPVDGLEVKRTVSSFQWPLAIGLAMLTVALGGYLSGCAIHQWGALGGVSLWALGGLSGWLAAKLLTPSRLLGYLLAACVVVAFLVAEVCWIHWKIIGAETWLDAIRLLPKFFKEYQLDAIMGGIWTFFGAGAAFRQAGFRYRYVRVVEQ